MRLAVVYAARMSPSVVLLVLNGCPVREAWRRFVFGCACRLLDGLGSQWYILGLLGVYIRTYVLVFECHMSVVTVDAALGKKGCS